MVERPTELDKFSLYKDKLKNKICLWDGTFEAHKLNEYMLDHEEGWCKQNHFTYSILVLHSKASEAKYGNFRSVQSSFEDKLPKTNSTSEVKKKCNSRKKQSSEEVILPKQFNLRKTLL